MNTPRQLGEQTGTSHDIPARILQKYVTKCQYNREVDDLLQIRVTQCHWIMTNNDRLQSPECDVHMYQTATETT